tara:strand:+ start:192 stop:815 length:624 start_codon:yes stop_codon:yes gene_type:complete
MPDGHRNLNFFFSHNSFIGSFYEIEKIPNVDLPEVCFIGRSNVGKSSLINSITKNKKLAKISKTPGRTQSINLYEIKKIINVIDLPGYGYAKVSKLTRDRLIILIESYLNLRTNLKMTYLLIDCKVGLKNSDIDFLDFLRSSNSFFSVILTKIDKCSKKLIEKQAFSLNTLLKQYGSKYRNIFLSSSKKNLGILDIQKDIYNLSKKV